MQAANKIQVVGIGYKPFGNKTRGIILNSDVILASNRLLDVFRRYEEFEAVKNKIKVISTVDETINFIRTYITKKQNPPLPPFAKGGRGGITECRKIVLLASGDPMFFGIGRRVVNEFGKDAVEIIPDLSSIQTAFSKIKEAWDNTFLMSLHGGPDPAKRRRLPYEINDIPFLLETHPKIAILTDRENNPAEIAKVLNSAFSARHSSLIIYVCERLGYPDEKIMAGTPEEISAMSFSEPNLVIVQTIDHKPQTTENPPSPPFSKGGMGGFLSNDKIRFGLTENEISHSRGLITKDEVRAVTIHKLSLPRKGVLWDVGAGSGSISIEAARICPGLKIFAIEKNQEQIGNIRKNKVSFGISNIEIIEGAAPEALGNLPSPDRIFIGGSGGRLKDIIDFIAETQAEIVVINSATIETLNEAVSCLGNRGFKVEVSQVSVSRSKILSGTMHMSALNPVFIITGRGTKHED